MSPPTSTAMASVRRDKAGVGSAVLNSMRQVGGSLGIAIMGAIVAASVTTQVGAAPDPLAVPDRVPPRPRGRDADRARGAPRSHAAKPSRKVAHPEPGQAPAAHAVEAA